VEFPGSRRRKELPDLTSLFEGLCLVGEGDSRTTGPTLTTTVHVVVGVTVSTVASNPGVSGANEVHRTRVLASVWLRLEDFWRKKPSRVPSLRAVWRRKPQ
jgi:hypothetical protein